MGNPSSKPPSGAPVLEDDDFDDDPIGPIGNSQAAGPRASASRLATILVEAALPKNLSRRLLAGGAIALVVEVPSGILGASHSPRVRKTHWG